MTKVTSLTPVKNYVNQAVVKELQSALNLAKSGRLQSVAIVGDLDGAETFSTTSTHDGVMTIGQLELLKMKVYNSLPMYAMDHVPSEDD